MRNLSIDEVFTWLTFADAARLIVSILATPLDGFHVYCPSAYRPLVGDTVEALRLRHYSHVPLKSPPPLKAFVNCDDIFEGFGWEPHDL